MANYVLLNVPELLNFAKGTTFQGFTTTTAPVSGDYASEGQALTYLNSQGWSVVQVIGYGPMKEYLLTHS